MKTNHRRNFIEKTHLQDHVFVRTKKLSTRAIGAWVSGCVANGNRGRSKAKAGMKKYLRVRERLDGKQQTKEIYE